ncbi:FXSXX-COOH protein [Streptomyces sp. NPDC001904]|uniref:FXSXX-COOH protein n=1 Tax=Streptomyces sp. NPDC001904 TaxID=3154531 RepID=UPI003329E7D2
MKDPNDAATVAPDHTAAPADCAGRLVDLRGFDLAELRDLDHPVLAEVIDDLLARIVDPVSVLAEYTQSIFDGRH